MSILNTVLEKVVLAPKEDFMRFENRLPDSSIVQAFLRDTENVISQAEMRRAKTALDAPVDIKVLNKKLYRVGPVRQINPALDVVDSAKVNLTWITKEFAFTFSEQINQNNYVSVADEMRSNIFNAISSVIYDSPLALEKNAAAYLNANAWATPPASTVAGVTVAAGAYNMLDEEFLYKAPVIMKELKLHGKPYLDISNIGALASTNRDSMYSTYNEKNIAQFRNQFSHFYSQEIAVPTDTVAAHYVVEPNSLALINRIEWDALTRNDDKDGEFIVFRDPWFGFDWGVYVTKARTNLSAQYGRGNERAVATQWHFAADFAFASPYSSVAGQSPIIRMNTLAPV